MCFAAAWALHPIRDPGFFPTLDSGATDTARNELSGSRQGHCHQASDYRRSGLPRFSSSSLVYLFYRKRKGALSAKLYVLLLDLPCRSLKL